MIAVIDNIDNNDNEGDNYKILMLPMTTVMMIMSMIVLTLPSWREERMFSQALLILPAESMVQARHPTPPRHHDPSARSIPDKLRRCNSGVTGMVEGRYVGCYINCQSREATSDPVASRVVEIICQ
jgi:hypothetical protein